MPNNVNINVTVAPQKPVNVSLGTPKISVTLKTVAVAPGAVTMDQLNTILGNYIPAYGAIPGTITGDFDFSQSILNIQEVDIVGSAGGLNIGFQSPFNMIDGAVVWKSVTPASVGNLGGGTRFQWDPMTASLSVGLAYGTEWDATNLGYYSYAFGQSVQMSSNSSFGVGSAILVPVGSDNVIALGDSISFDGNSPNTIAIGSGQNITNSNASLLMGGSNTVNGNNNAALGLYGTIDGSFNYIYGYQNSITGGISSSIALGSNNSVTNNYGTAIGYGSTVSGSSGVAVGLSNTASGFQSTAIGAAVVSSGAKAVTFGAAITNSIINSLAFGVSGKYFHVRGGSVTKQGTVATTSGSNVVTGTGTAFLNSFIPGDRITIGSETYTIQTITSATSLTVSSPYTTTNAAGSLYTIVPAISAYFRKSDGFATQFIRDDGWMFVGSSASPAPLSVLDVQGSFGTANLTANGNVIVPDTCQHVWATTTLTATLPNAALVEGRIYGVFTIAGTTTTISNGGTFTGGGVSGASSFVNSTTGKCIHFKARSGNWYIIS